MLTGLAYFLFHLRLGPDAWSIWSGTLAQMLLTAPYAIGFTYILLFFHRRLSVGDGGPWPRWDAILRIFFTIGILFGFFFALYEYASGEKIAIG